MLSLQLALLPAHYLGYESDDTLYALAARSLLNGRYALGIGPGDPPLLSITPGWPLLLAPAAALSGGKAAGYHVWAWGWLAGACALLWLWMRRRAGACAANAVLLLFGLNPLVLSRSGAVMSELPFLACALALLLALEEGLPGWAAGLALGGCWLIRPAAAPLWAGVLLFFLLQRRWKGAASALAASLPLLLLWKAWTAAAGVPLPEVAELRENLPGGFFALAGMAGRNFFSLFELWGRSVLPLREAPAAFAFPTGALLGSAACAGFWLRRREPAWAAAGAFIGVSLIMHAFWPWWYERYLPPLLPFLFAGLWACAHALKGELFALVLSLLLSIPALAVQGPGLFASAALRARPEFAASYAWARGRSAEHELFLAVFDAREAWYLGRPTLAFTALRPEDRGAEGLRRLRVRWVFWPPIPELGASRPDDFAWRGALSDFEAALHRPPFRLAHRDASSGAAVYELPPGT